ncbi:hypothetical protein SASPL_105598 [Salvia splendens]|uniref:Small subunit ribosomal protein S16 n=1 Tax=Salvia splendens TaxID=180675 RepID=A0A8X9ABR1_SALSN|nr:hypothetical protein SASPL_105598 [Salvia splendens]
MAVRLRLSRFGCRSKPFYRLMAADSRSPRDGKHLEVLGYYNLLPGQDGGKRMGVNFDRVNFLDLFKLPQTVKEYMFAKMHEYYDIVMSPITIQVLAFCWCTAI